MKQIKNFVVLLIMNEASQSKLCCAAWELTKGRMKAHRHLPLMPTLEALFPNIVLQIILSTPHFVVGTCVLFIFE